MAVKRLYQEIAEQLLILIDSDLYKAGDRLPSERELAIKYNVSRPTMREAVIALEIDGYVEVKKGSGVYISKERTGSSKGVSLKGIGAFDLAEARLIVESEAATLAARQVTTRQLKLLEIQVQELKQVVQDRDKCATPDHKFHLELARASQNVAIFNVISELWSAWRSSAMVTRLYKHAWYDGFRTSIQEHENILYALKDGDGVAAKHAMTVHLSNLIDCLLMASETEAINNTRQDLAQKRDRYSRSLFLKETG